MKNKKKMQLTKSIAKVQSYLEFGLNNAVVTGARTQKAAAQ